MSTVHELKCWPAPFAAMRSGAKRFEYRKDDRNYQVGDVLWNREWMPPTGGDATPGFGYTGREDRYRVTYKLAGRFGVPDGYCVLGVEPEATPPAHAGEDDRAGRHPYAAGEADAGSEGFPCESKRGVTPCANRTSSIWLTASEWATVWRNRDRSAFNVICENKLGIALCPLCASAPSASAPVEVTGAWIGAGTPPKHRDSVWCATVREGLPTVIEGRHDHHGWWLLHDGCAYSFGEYDYAQPTHWQEIRAPAHPAALTAALKGKP